MFFPIRTDRRLNQLPLINLTLIAVNVAVFLLSRALVSPSELSAYLLTPTLPRPWQFLTYQFLHLDVWHLGANMLFLYVFGHHVEDRLGKAAYLGFYLAGGVVAGLGHALFALAPVLGASGSVCAVTGAYLALFPLSYVTIVYWFVVVGSFEVSGFVLILFQVGQDIVMYLLRGGGVAYLAHLFGYGFGFVVGMALLLTRLLPREPYDLLSLAEHRRRRHEFRRMTRGGYRPWELTRAPRDAGDAAPLSAQQQRILDQRSSVNAALGRQDLSAAAEAYRELLRLDPRQTLAQGPQLDVANQLMSQGQHESAAHAYELFLNTFQGYTQREQVELMLALLYVRYLHRLQRARELLRSALPRLRDAKQSDLARTLLAEVEG